MTLIHTIAVLAALAASSPVFADTDCSDPIESWKPREALRQEVEQRGWTVQRIKVDDHCYEVRGLDAAGNKVKAKFSPATLRIRSLEVEFGTDGDPSAYFGPPHRRGGRHALPPAANKGNLP